ncbi:MAG: glutathione S-transferase family protein [Rhodospirillales bacterium]|nr:glutathione S-transferase family protein [Rhodospirillales bacterium]
MTYTLYGSDGSGSFVVEAALDMAGADYTKIDVDMSAGAHQDATFAAINPMKQVPTLILPDGAVMTESAAIALHLADAFPGKSLAPELGTVAHAQFVRWMVFISNNLYEGVLRYFYSDRYTTDDRAEAVDSVKNAAHQHLQNACGVIEAHLTEHGPWLAGQSMTMADVYFTMLHGWHPDMVDPTMNENLTTLAQAVRSNTDIGQLLQRHGL